MYEEGDIIIQQVVRLGVNELQMKGKVYGVADVYIFCAQQQLTHKAQYRVWWIADIRAIGKCEPALIYACINK